MPWLPARKKPTVQRFKSPLPVIRENATASTTFEPPIREKPRTGDPGANETPDAADEEPDVEAGVPSPSSSPTIVDSESSAGANTPTSATSTVMPSPASSTSADVVVFDDYTFLIPSKHFDRTQLAFIFIINGLYPAFLAGVFSFLIAFLMYGLSEPDPDAPVRLLQVPHSLAGDAAISILIHCIITWFIVLLLTNKLLRTASVRPIGFIREPKSRILRWFMFLNIGPASINHVSWRQRMSFLGNQLLRALIVSILAFLLLWGPGIAFLMMLAVPAPATTPESSGSARIAETAPDAITLVQQHTSSMLARAVSEADCAKDWCFPNMWTPQLFKMIRGCVLGLLITPLFAMFWMTRCGWALIHDREYYGATARG